MFWVGWGGCQPLIIYFCLFSLSILNILYCIYSKPCYPSMTPTVAPVDVERRYPSRQAALSDTPRCPCQRRVTLPRRPWSVRRDTPQCHLTAQDQVWKKPWNLPLSLFDAASHSPSPQSARSLTPRWLGHLLFVICYLSALLKLDYLCILKRHRDYLGWRIHC